MKQPYLFLIVVLCFLGTTTAQEISDTSFGKGMINFVAKDSSFSVKFAPRFQGRYIIDWEHDGDNYGSGEQNFLIRRARLKFDGFVFSPKIKYKFELGLSNRDISGANQFNRNTPRYILDAVIKWNFYENFELWAGQTKLPGNVERVVSSGNLQFINRSILNSRFNIDRDAGIQLRHHADLGGDFFIREKIAISQGEGRNVTQGNEGGLQYTARLELLPFGKFKSKGDYSQSDLKREPKPKLMLGATYDFNQDAVKTRSNLGSYMFLSDGSLYMTDQTTIFVDAMFKYKGFSFAGEYANRDADNPVAVEADGTPALDSDGLPTGDVVLIGNSVNLQAGYLFKNNYEIAGRFTTAEYDDITGRAMEEQYTLGVSRYVVGHKLKIQSDFTYGTSGGDADFLQFRIGFDIHL
ncbi:MAG: OprO/OprP family phosphate-selective porin [Bacteroidia bacterium]|nr:OprO/OprP family phosphate-selective porin [Bacteroidia bacterium]NNF30749.1 porin [Flavobacteriaceae bacterium]MBT8277206.1 OprO/OprP family phosphate-selective porin [Bacteroidia bacterium]NNJ81457.1 porin [Flavobacteriaceae bacterium]NNK54783.1 porin [Flavobacteriaceae bacterium]